MRRAGRGDELIDEKRGSKLADYAAKIIPSYARTFGYYPQ
jgi:hypothetical protein